MNEETNKKPEWLTKLIDDVREASRAFKSEKEWPEAWLYLGEYGDDTDWYDWDETLLGLPVYHCPAWLRHSGCDGEHQRILPLWRGDVSGKGSVIREFQCRLAHSGDY
jgi:hypothetical protein